MFNDKWFYFLVLVILVVVLLAAIRGAYLSAAIIAAAFVILIVVQYKLRKRPAIKFVPVQERDKNQEEDGFCFFSKGLTTFSHGTLKSFAFSVYRFSMPFCFIVAASRASQ